MVPAFFSLLGLAILAYAAFLWAGGKTSERNLLSGAPDFLADHDREIDKGREPEEFYLTLWLWVAVGIAAIGYGFYLKFFR